MGYSKGQKVFFKPPWTTSKKDWEELEVTEVHETYLKARNKSGHVNQYTFNVIVPKDKTFDPGY